MSHETLRDEVKARVPERMKEALEELAARRHLKAADLVREALREYLDKQAAGSHLHGKLAGQDGEAAGAFS